MQSASLFWGAGYNVVAIPMAVAGMVTPVIAAIVLVGVFVSPGWAVFLALVVLGLAVFGGSALLRKR